MPKTPPKKSQASKPRRRRTRKTAALLACSKCSEVFTQKKYLKNHAAVHSDERPYVCACNSKYKYKYKKGLDRHKKKCTVPDPPVQEAPQTIDLLLDLIQPIEDQGGLPTPKKASPTHLGHEVPISSPLPALQDQSGETWMELDDTMELCDPQDRFD